MFKDSYSKHPSWLQHFLSVLHEAIIASSLDVVRMWGSFLQLEFFSSKWNDTEFLMSAEYRIDSHAKRDAGHKKQERK